MVAPAEMAASEGRKVPRKDRLIPPAETEEEQQALLDDIDAILARIDVRLAEQHAKMDDLLDRINRKVP